MFSMLSKQNSVVVGGHFLYVIWAQVPRCLRHVSTFQRRTLETLNDEPSQSIPFWKGRWTGVLNLRWVVCFDQYVLVWAGNSDAMINEFQSRTNVACLVSLALLAKLSHASGCDEFWYSHSMSVLSSMSLDLLVYQLKKCNNLMLFCDA